MFAGSLGWAGHAHSGWETWRVGDGLARNEVHSIVEDRSGALWFGSYRGVASRFDGVNWSSFTIAEGSPDNDVISDVTSMVVDHAGVLWFASRGTGVVRYDGTSWRTFTQADGLASNEVSCVLEDRSGALWFGTSDRGVTRYDGVSWRTFTEADGLAGNGVDAMLEDHNGGLWFATSFNQGVSRYDGVSWRTFTEADGLAYGGVDAMAQGPDGALWFATSPFGVSRYDGTSWRTFTTADGLASNSVKSMHVDRSGAVWFGTFGSGVSRFDGVSWRTFTTADGLAGNGVDSICEDRQGGLWFGTPGDGVSRYDGASWRTLSATTFAEPAVAMLKDNDGALWFGTDGAGVIRYDGTSWRSFTTVDGLADDHVYAMLQDRSGVLWFGTWGYGVSRYDGVSWSTFTMADGLAGNEVVSMLQDRSGALWFGTWGDGLSRYDGTTWRTVTTADSLAGMIVISMLEDRTGALWFGTFDGVSRYDDSGWRTFTTSDGLVGDDVSVMMEDRKGALWFGSYDGLSRLDETGWRSFTSANGLASRGAYSMLEDRSGTLWFGSLEDGLSHYDGETWRTLTTASGLAYNGVLAIQEDRTGALWFATRSKDAGAGVSIYTPDRVAPRSVFVIGPPRVSTSRISSIGVLPAFRDRSILFQNSLDHGPWSSWSPVGTWPAAFLPDGEYKWRVRARDDYGNVESPPESLEFEIDATPPSPVLRFPVFDSFLRDSIEIRGTASDARFGYYRLEYHARGSTPWIVLKDTTRTPVTDGPIGDWATSGLADGKYEIRLSVTDTLGLTGTTIVPVFVDNHFPYAAQTSPASVRAAVGGDVYTEDSSAHLYIPPNGLSQDTTVTVATLDTSAVPAILPTGAIRLSSGVELGWGRVRLSKTATLDMFVPMSDAAPAIYTEAPDSSWHRLGGTMDPTTRRLAVPVVDPGRYAVFIHGGGSTVANTARLSGITLTPRALMQGVSPTTSVAVGFSLGSPGAVSVKVYNRAGRLIREVASGLQLEAGANLVRWDGRDQVGGEVEDGVYLVAVVALGVTQTQMLAVVR